MTFTQQRSLVRCQDRLAAASTVFYLAFGIFQPFSAIESVAGVVLMVGILFAVLGGVGSLV